MTKTPDRRDKSLAGLPRSHDAYFKAMLLWPALRADLVRCLLPPGVQGMLAPGSPALEAGNFQRPDLGQLHTDVLLNVPLQGAPPDDRLYLVLEHKSEASPNIHSQLGFYQVALMRHLETEHEKEPPNRRQHPIVKWVIYNGHEEWQIPQRSSEQVGRHPALAEVAAKSFDSGYELLDLRHTPMAGICPGFPRLIAFMLALRGHISERGLASRRRKQPDLWQQPEPALEEQLTLMADGFKDAPEAVKEQHLCYIMFHRHWTQHVEQATILARVAKPLFGSEEGETRMLSLMERHEQAAVAKKRPAILAEGIAQGEVAGIARMLIQQLERKFGVPAVDGYKARIVQADVKQLGIWSERVLDASSIEVVFDDSPLPQHTRINGAP